MKLRAGAHDLTHRLPAVTGLVLCWSLVLLPFFGGTASAQTSAAGRSNRVLIFSMPYVSWSDISRFDLPNLQKLLAVSSLGNLTVRTAGATSLLPGYVTLGAGSRASSGTGDVAGQAFEANEQFGSLRGAAAYEQRTGRAAGDGAIVNLGVGVLRRANQGADPAATAGALGDALTDNGFGRAVIANADMPTADNSVPLYSRSAVAALMDSEGQVPAGAVGQQLLEHNAGAPFGVRLSVPAVREVFVATWRPRSVVLVEASDLVRTAAFLPLTTPEQATVLTKAALTRTDKLLGSLLREVDFRRDTVLLVGPAPTASSHTVTPVALHVPGERRGLLRSASTRRTGNVLLADVAPTILDVLSVDRPEGMSGQRFTIEPSNRGVYAMIDSLAAGADAAMFRDRVQGAVIISFTTLEGALAVGIFAVLRKRRRDRARSLVHLGALAALAYVPAVFLARLFPFHDWGFSAYGAFLAVATIVLASLYRVIGRSGAEQLMAGLAVIVVLLIADVVTGAHLQLSTPFGYTPTIGVRLAGFGNISYAALSASALLLAAFVIGRIGGAWGIWLGIGLLGAATITDTAPFWGADVGGVLSMVPAYALTAALWLGIRPRRKLRSAFALFSLTIIGLAIATAIDVSRPAIDRTHLGRLALNISEKGLEPLTNTLSRKLEQNLNTLLHSNWRPMVVIGVLFIVCLVMLERDRVHAITERVPPLGPALIGFTVLAVLGYLFNDSGIAIPAMMLAVLEPVLVCLLLEPVSDRASSPPPDLELRAVASQTRAIVN